jgi:hypothetical protein
MVTLTVVFMVTDRDTAMNGWSIVLCTVKKEQCVVLLHTACCCNGEFSGKVFNGLRDEFLKFGAKNAAEDAGNYTL